jgi:hypothetical protein
VTPLTKNVFIFGPIHALYTEFKLAGALVMSELSNTAMTNQDSAQVIPFPARNGAADGAARLAQALAKLHDALEDQRRAVADWQFAMTELGVGVAALSHSVAGYQDSLGRVDTKLRGLREESLRLEAWADTVIAE